MIGILDSIHPLAKGKANFFVLFGYPLLKLFRLFCCGSSGSRDLVAPAGQERLWSSIRVFPSARSEQIGGIFGWSQLSGVINDISDV